MKRILYIYTIFLFLFPIYTVVVLNRGASFLDELALLSFGLFAFANNLLRRNYNFHLLFLAFTLLYVYSFAVNAINNVGLIFSMKSIYYSYQFVVYIYVMLSLRMSFSEFQKYFRFLEILFLIVCVIGLINWASNNSILNYFGYSRHFRFGIYRLNSIFEHPVTMGWLAAVFALFYGFQLLGNFAQKIKLDKLLVSKLLLSLTILALSNSRKSWIAYLIVMGVFFFYYYYPLLSIKRKFRILSLSILMLGAVGFITFDRVSFYFESAATEEGYIDNYDKVARVMLYIAGYQITKDYFPIGVGVGKYGGVNSIEPYSHVYYEYNLHTIWGISPEQPNFITDGYWHKPMGELGFIGVLMYMVLFMYFFRRVNRDIEFKKDFVYSQYAVFSLSILTLTMIEGIAAANFTNSFFTFFAIGLPVLLISVKRYQRCRLET